MNILTGVISYLLYSIRHHPEYEIWQYVLIGMDRTATLFVVSQMMNNMFGGVYLQQLFSHVYSHHFTVINNKFRKLAIDLTLMNNNKITRKNYNDWLLQLQQQQNFQYKIQKLQFDSKILSLNNSTGISGNMIQMINWARLKFTLNQLISQHTSLIRFITYLNRMIISPEVFIFVIFNIPYNIYLVTKIAIGIIPHMLVMICAGAQFLSWLLSNSTSIVLNETIYAAFSYLVTIQLNLNNNNNNNNNENDDFGEDNIETSLILTKSMTSLLLLSKSPFHNNNNNGHQLSLLSEKLRLLSLLEQLNSTNEMSRLGFTVGPIGLISANSSLKVKFFFICLI